MDSKDSSYTRAAQAFNSAVVNPFRKMASRFFNSASGSAYKSLFNFKRNSGPTNKP